MHCFELANGLRVVVAPTHAAPVVALQVWVGAGSAQEKPEEAGIAHFLEHMLFKGTRNRGVGQIAREVEAAGGDINAWTEFNNTVYHLALASRYLPLGLDVLADAVQYPTIDATELERERQVIVEEMQQGEDSPHRTNFQQLFATAFRRHPYRRPVIGRKETVMRLQRADLRAFHRRQYAPDNLTLVVAGDLDPAEVESRTRKAFRRRGHEPVGRPSFDEPRQRKHRISLKGGAVRDAYLLAGFHIPGLAHEDAAGIDLAATLLGQGDSSRLSVRVLRERQLVNDVSSYAYSPHDEGLFTVGATLPPDRLEEAVSALLGEVFLLSAEPATREEIDKARLLEESNSVMHRETAQGLARRMGYYAYAVGDPDYEATYQARVGEVTPGKMRRALARYLQPENCTLSLVVPDEWLTPARRDSLLERLHSMIPEVASRVFGQRRVVVPRPGKGGIIRTQLDNGATVLVKPDHTVPMVAVRGLWTGGLRLETPRQNGINNLIANLLVRGTSRRSGDEIVREIESMAGGIGGFSGRNSLGIRMETLSRNWVASLDIMADCLLDPTFPADELAREQDLALQEIATRDDNLTGSAFRLFQRTLFRRHPYRLSLGGEADSVSRLGPESLRRFYRKHYRPEALTLSVVGDVDPAEVIAELSRRFQDAPTRPAHKPKVPVEPPVERPRRAEQHLEKQQAHLLIGFPGVRVSHRDRHHLEVMAAVLAGQGGRLFLDLRDRQGLVYRVSAFSLEGLDPGYFAVYAATSPDKVDTVVSSIRAVLAELRRSPIPADEVKRAKRYLIGNHDLSLQQRATLASTIAFNEIYGLGYNVHLAYSSLIGAVSSRELQRAARKYLKPKREVIAMVLPESDT